MSRVCPLSNSTQDPTDSAITQHATAKLIQAGADLIVGW